MSGARGALRRRRLSGALGLAAALLSVCPGCGWMQVADADLGSSLLTGSIELRQGPRSREKHVGLFAGYLGYTGTGEVDVYGRDVPQPCTAGGEVVRVGCEWGFLENEGRRFGGGISFGAIYAHQEIEYRDFEPVSEEESDVRLWGDAGYNTLLIETPGVFAWLALSEKSYLRLDVHTPLIALLGTATDFDLTETVLAYQYELRPGLRLTAGWRHLKIETSVQPHFPLGFSGSQYAVTSGNGFSAGLVVEF